jgi:hypothetical protein
MESEEITVDVKLKYATEEAELKHIVEEVDLSMLP